MLSFWKKFNQGIIISGCSLISFATMGFIINDAHNLEKKTIINTYENKMNELKNENVKLKLENYVIKSKQMQ